MMAVLPGSEYRTYRVLARDRQPLIDFIVDALHVAGCRVLHVPPADVAPFRFTFETPIGERMGIIVYAFLANQKATKNRPSDEHRFQVKYGSKGDGSPQPIFHDPYDLYTTLFLGINPERGFFVGADPWLHNPTKFFISIEFKDTDVEIVLDSGWAAWERERRSGSDEPVEVLIGGTREHFLRYVYFERAALREDQGHRHWLAENIENVLSSPVTRPGTGTTHIIEPPNLHALAEEFELAESEVLDLIEKAPRLKMAVRGWVAEEHLFRELCAFPGVTDCVHIQEEGGADVRLRYRGSMPLEIECKNVLRRTTAQGLARIDFQRTRVSKSDPCTRYYKPTDFDVVAGCLHAVSSKWEFRYALPGTLDPHPRCAGRIWNNVRIDQDRWSASPEPILELAAALS